MFHNENENELMASNIQINELSVAIINILALVINEQYHYFCCTYSSCDGDYFDCYIVPLYWGMLYAKIFAFGCVETGLIHIFELQHSFVTTQLELFFVQFEPN